MKFNFWKKEKREQPKINPDDLLPNVNGGLLSGLFSSNVQSTSLSAVFSAIELISNSIGQLPIYVKTNKEGKSQIIEKHSALSAIKNCDMTKFMLIKSIVVDMLMYGDGLIYIERKPNGEPLKLHYCPHGSYSIFRKSDYIGEERTIYHLNNLKKSKNVEDIDVIHIFKNSDNGYSGKGVLQYANQTLKLATFAEKSASNFFQGGCHLGGVLSTSQTSLPKKVKQEIKDAWQIAHGGTNANGVAILEAGMTYQPITANSRDAQLLESRLYSLQEIARFFTINPVLLGDLSKSSYSTIESANLEFVQRTLLPIITLLQEEFSRKLLLPNEKHLFVDIDETYLLRGDKAATASYYSTLVEKGIMTRNEARESLGLNKVDGGDDLIIPFTKIEDNKVGELDNE